MTLALNLLTQLEEYYGKKITTVPIAAKVWIELLNSISPKQATALVEKIITEEQWLPSVANVRLQFLPALQGQDFEGELKKALEAYSTHDRAAQKKIPEHVKEAIRQVGGVAAFMHANNRQYKELFKKYSNHRANQQQSQAPQLSPANNRSRVVIGQVA